MEAEEYAGWLTKDAVMAELGISERTLDRRINELGINKAYRPALGRKAIPLLEPEGVARLKALQEQTPDPVIVKTPPRQLPQRYQENGHSVTVKTEPPPLIPSQISQALTEWFGVLTGPRYLTLAEAAVLLGLPESHLTRERKSGRLRGVKVSGRWRFLRGDVMAYRVAAE